MLPWNNCLILSEDALFFILLLQVTLALTTKPMHLMPMDICCQLHLDFFRSPVDLQTTKKDLYAQVYYTYIFAIDIDIKKYTTSGT